MNPFDFVDLICRLVVCQGNTLSPFLFIIVMEAFYVSMNSDVNTGENKWMWYGDDSGIFLVNSLRRTLEINRILQDLSLMWWCRWIPIRVKSFIWHAWIRRILAKVGLMAKGSESEQFRGNAGSEHLAGGLGLTESDMASERTSERKRGSGMSERRNSMSERVWRRDSRRVATKIQQWWWAMKIACEVKGDDEESWVLVK
ncbi:hypothetical protein QVD17_28449 [Tagetes erecta]|uniref:Reverse transcriptase zinc-binding domain-containing protein n=1 Tax=Tagetes erecta TaxID=13708 RepID=A0AAD8KAE2_TARER|nr:hypothetical protein QVD17_28449 [Tagetes erecta]